jgi:hypothetical protein
MYQGGKYNLVLGYKRILKSARIKRLEKMIHPDSGMTL